MKKKITAVLGDFYHERSIAVKSFESAVQRLNQQSNTELEIDYLPVSELMENIQTNPDAVVLFAENRINPQDDVVKRWMTEDDASLINKYVENGGGWLAWHAGLASYENMKEYITMLRGHFIHHPKEHQVVHYYADSTSDSIHVEKSFEFLDEHYFVHCDEQNTNVFLKSESVDGSSIAGWYHEYGKGQVVCLTPAHLEEGLLNEDFLNILVQCLKLSFE
ncbi:ThuA domain-containing protein [Aquibacillus albus]|uniref:Type 1 glutamine amidotransferase n=1 Tax=Aquibacillus albus TaxID=1168171 RepID=A0ABS2MVP1_9BACI|nr:ThuA domain-containing protein [Aquibacillus albus]MBM7569976.1 type 1 glutamine amidotransferase [Aquibacillus albus]